MSKETMPKVLLIIFIMSLIGGFTAAFIEADKFEKMVRNSDKRETVWTDDFFTIEIIKGDVHVSKTDY